MVSYLARLRLALVAFAASPCMAQTITDPAAFASASQHHRPDNLHAGGGAAFPRPIRATMGKTVGEADRRLARVTFP